MESKGGIKLSWKEMLNVQSRNIKFVDYNVEEVELGDIVRELSFKDYGEIAPGVELSDGRTIVAEMGENSCMLDSSPGPDHRTLQPVQLLVSDLFVDSIIIIVYHVISYINDRFS